MKRQMSTREMTDSSPTGYRTWSTVRKVLAVVAILIFAAAILAVGIL